MKKLLLGCAASALLAGSAMANSLVSPGPATGIAKSALSARPDSEWNRLSYRSGKNVEIWTVDGDQLNKLTFYAAVPAGETLFKERDKKNKPLPRVQANMLITDIPALLETSYRSDGLVMQMHVDTQEAAMLGGHRGIRFTYSFVRNEDEVERKGEAVGALVGNQLYLVTYEAPSVYFFDKDVDHFRQVVSTLKL